MIKQIKVENYKSVFSLELDLGRVNVFIGENGSGKTNILEAVALGSAASENKLDSEYLFPRGIRVVSPKMMKSGFENSQFIRIYFSNTADEEADIEIDTINSENLIWRRTAWNRACFKIRNDEITPEYKKVFEQLVEFGLKAELVGDYFCFDENNYINNYNISNLFAENKVLREKLSQGRWAFFNLDRFLIFCPENTYLRRFEEEGQIRPLGIRGEGLFSHLADLSRNKPEVFKKINESLRLIDWFEGFEIPNDLMFTERRIRIKDRYLEEGIQYIDQRSSNEGFLYLLFYVTLFVSPHTPKFFAIDNVDNALNPKLCSKLIEVLVQLAKEHDKQVILTAHNPGLLDGLNLKDEEQRLFVISRNKLGHTKALRIEQKPSVNGHEPVRLSEQFLRGYIGGLPKNF